MIFEIKCWIARKIGGLSGWICGFFSGIKLAKNGYNDDVAGYIFNKINDENTKKWEAREKELLDKNENLGLVKILIHGIKANIEVYKEVCAKIKSNKERHEE